MDTSKVTVTIDENGAILAVKVDGHAEPTELEMTTPSEPMPAFGDEKFQAQVRPWLAV